MGKIADDMARLADSIVDARTERAEMKVRLAAENKARHHQVNAKLNQIAAEQAEQAHRDKTARVAFVDDLSKKVDTMLNEFDAEHQDMAKSSKTARQNTVKRIKHDVNTQLDNFAEELAAAREMWHGTAGKRKTRAAKTATNLNADVLGSLTRDFAADLPQRPRTARIRTRRRG